MGGIPVTVEEDQVFLLLPEMTLETAGFVPDSQAIQVQVVVAVPFILATSISNRCHRLTGHGSDSIPILRVWRTRSIQDLLEAGSVLSSFGLGRLAGTLSPSSPETMGPTPAIYGVRGMA